jgi:hypothetical protein
MTSADNLNVLTDLEARKPVLELQLLNLNNFYPVDSMQAYELILELQLLITSNVTCN